MRREEGISVELRRRGIAASTLREALGPWILAEPERLVRALASAPATLDAVLAIKGEATAYVKLKRELDAAMSDGGIDEA